MMLVFDGVKQMQFSKEFKVVKLVSFVGRRIINTQKGCELVKVI